MKTHTLLTTAGLLGLVSLTTADIQAQTHLNSGMEDRNIPTEMDSTMHLAQVDHDAMPMDHVENEFGEPVHGRATVKQVDKQSRAVTLDHEPIPEWQWPRMTMNFQVAEEVDLTELKEGSQIEFAAVRPDDSEVALLLQIHPVTE